MLIVVTRLYSEEELPAEFKLYLPVQQKGGHQVERQKDTGVERQKDTAGETSNMKMCFRVGGREVLKEEWRRLRCSSLWKLNHNHGKQQQWQTTMTNKHSTKWSNSPGDHIVCLSPLLFLSLAPLLWFLQEKNTGSPVWSVNHNYISKPGFCKVLKTFKFIIEWVDDLKNTCRATAFFFVSHTLPKCISKTLFRQVLVRTKPCF